MTIVGEGKIDSLGGQLKNDRLDQVCLYGRIYSASSLTYDCAMNQKNKHFNKGHSQRSNVTSNYYLLPPFEDYSIRIPPFLILISFAYKQTWW